MYITISLCYRYCRSVSIFLDTHKTAEIENSAIVEIIKKVFELKPAGINAWFS